MNIQELLSYSERVGASDLNLTAGVPPLIQVGGGLRRTNLPDLSRDEVRSMIRELMTDKQRDFYRETTYVNDYVVGHEIAGVTRLRIAAFNHSPEAEFAWIHLDRPDAKIDDPEMATGWPGDGPHA